MVYAESMEAYAGAMRESKLAARREEFGPKLQALDRYLLGNLQPALDQFAADSLFGESVRENLKALHANCTAMKSHIDNPRGPYTTYRQKARELKEKHDRLLGLVISAVDLPHDLVLHLPGGLEITIKRT